MSRVPLGARNAEAATAFEGTAGTPHTFDYSDDVGVGGTST